jgi:hippurate hydrolase
MEGTIRTYEEEVRAKVKERVKAIAEQTALAHGCTAEVKFEDRYPATINHPVNALYVRQAAARAFGADQVVDFNPSVASEDFSYFLHRRPGAMVFIGNGPNTMLHKANYCFREANVQRGATLWLTLLEDRLGVSFEGTEI